MRQNSKRGFRYLSPNQGPRAACRPGPLVLADRGLEALALVLADQGLELPRLFADEGRLGILRCLVAEAIYSNLYQFISIYINLYQIYLI